jgi:hypothetical protein
MNIVVQRNLNPSDPSPSTYREQTGEVMSSPLIVRAKKRNQMEKKLDFRTQQNLHLSKKDEEIFRPWK